MHNYCTCVSQSCCYGLKHLMISSFFIFSGCIFVPQPGGEDLTKEGKNKELLNSTA